MNHTRGENILIHDTIHSRKHISGQRLYYCFDKTDKFCYSDITIPDRLEKTSEIWGRIIKAAKIIEQAIYI